MIRANILKTFYFHEFPWNIMTTPAAASSSLYLRFPNFGEFDDINALSVILQDLSTTYEVTAMAVLPGYEREFMPITRIGPRRYSRLRAADRLEVKHLSLASPLEISFAIMSISASVNMVARSANRTAVAAKAWLGVLASGVDFQKRRQELEQSIVLAPEQLRQNQLQNEIAAEELRKVRAQADMIVGLREAYFAEAPSPSNRESSQTAGVERQLVRRRADSMTAEDFAQLLDEPVRRILGLAGGELDIGTGDGETAASS